MKLCLLASSSSCPERLAIAFASSPQTLLGQRQILPACCLPTPPYLPVVGMEKSMARVGLCSCHSLALQGVDNGDVQGRAASPYPLGNRDVGCKPLGAREEVLHLLLAGFRTRQQPFCGYGFLGGCGRLSSPPRAQGMVTICCARPQAGWARSNPH